MDFKNVDNKFRPIPFWSWNDKLETEETARQIKEMYGVGIGGFFMHARGGLQTDYMGEEWFENVEESIKSAKELGMHPWAYDENGWPSGFGGGAVNGKGIKYQQKYLRYEIGEKETETTIKNIGGIHFYYEVNPFYVDTLDGEVIKEFIDTIYEPYYKKYGNDLEGFFTDEPQVSRKGIPWSFTLPEAYKKEYGEDITEKLNELFFNTGDFRNTRIKFWRLITKLFSENFMKQIHDWCESRNLKLTGHMVCDDELYLQLTSNGACMPQYEYMTIPGMDWLGRRNDDDLTPYQVGSAARQFGKKQVLSETFALCGHNIGHDELKCMYEHQMVRGINLLCQHLEGYTNRGIRKRDYPPAMYIQQPWWKEYKVFNDSMSRIGMLLTEGEDGVDTLLIHPQTTAWTMYKDGEIYGDDSDRKAIMALNDEFCGMMVQLEKKHINFHLGDEFIMERHGRVEGGCLIIGEKKYSKIILPPCDAFFENTLRLLTEFTKAGGEIVTIDQLPYNDIIDIPEITYCQRRCKDYNMYYFVNSTENTFDAVVKKGNLIMDIKTGELLPFDGHHTFNKYESLVVIDNFGERAAKSEKEELSEIDLSGEWKVKSCSENVLTLDYCDYYFDGVLEEENGYVLNIMNRALKLKKPVNIKSEFRFNADFVPEKLYLVCETPEIFEISVNGEKAGKTDCGFFRDKAFRKIDISKYVKKGENTITFEVLFTQSEQVYQNHENSFIFESEKNKLTFDMEIEQIYLVGDFAVECRGEWEELPKNASRFSGEFVICEPKKAVVLSNIERQGFPFFAGEITLSKTFEKGEKFAFSKEGVNALGVRINGEAVDVFMWEPFEVDIRKYLKDGENEIEITILNNLRNMQGPLHLSEGECYRVVPSSFYKEECVWFRNQNNDADTRWNDNYCFTNISVKNKL